ncbi:Magnesium Transporter Nipa4 [Manis pentadactyla]|nr:Magnesium Transporter Nipa4 [Manis pentadactyla]
MLLSGLKLIKLSSGLQGPGMSWAFLVMTGRRPLTHRHHPNVLSMTVEAGRALNVPETVGRVSTHRGGTSETAVSTPASKQSDARLHSQEDLHPAPRGGRPGARPQPPGSDQPPVWKLPSGPTSCPGDPGYGLQTPHCGIRQEVCPVPRGARPRAPQETQTLSLAERPMEPWGP